MSTSSSPRSVAHALSEGVSSAPDAAPNRPHADRARIEAAFAARALRAARAADAFVAVGKLDPDARRRIEAEQALTGAGFAATAARLGLLSSEDARTAAGVEAGRLHPEAAGLAIPPLLETLRRPRSAAARGIEALRARLLTMRDAERLKLFAFASLERSPQADFLAVNLAASLARTGRRVALVDADLRFPRLQRAFGSPDGPALVDVLRGESDIEAARRESLVVGLSLVFAGRPGEDPQLDLAAGALRAILVRLTEDHEFVMVIPAPLDAAGDARYVWSACGAVIPLVRRHRDRTADLRRLRETLRQTGAETLGSVMLT